MEFLQTRMSSWEVFWVFFYGFATYGNAGFMREQVCKYMCPYARFQSAMFDKDTLIVSYDAGRGEPRGPRSRSADYAAKGLGTCVDCTLCVQVCPTGIDIRNGLQYECIGCGACADVCDTVMDKMGYPRGLVRYTTQNAVATPAGRGRRSCATCCGRACCCIPPYWAPSAWPCWPAWSCARRSRWMWCATARRCHASWTAAGLKTSTAFRS
jgi:cytochrome c oxidase accessory protein FixG